jgi:hypothetical protein
MTAPAGSAALSARPVPPPRALQPRRLVAGAGVGDELLGPRLCNVPGAAVAVDEDAVEGAFGHHAADCGGPRVHCALLCEFEHVPCTIAVVRVVHLRQRAVRVVRLQRRVRIEPAAQVVPPAREVDLLEDDRGLRVDCTDLRGSSALSPRRPSPPARSPDTGTFRARRSCCWP